MKRSAEVSFPSQKQQIQQDPIIWPPPHAAIKDRPVTTESQVKCTQVGSRENRIKVNSAAEYPIDAFATILEHEQHSSQVSRVTNDSSELEDDDDNDSTGSFGSLGWVAHLDDYEMIEMDHVTSLVSQPLQLHGIPVGRPLAKKPKLFIQDMKHVQPICLRLENKGTNFRHHHCSF